MTTLIDAIKELQLLKGLSDGQFAKTIDVDPSTWSKIKSGQRPPGGKFLRQAASSFPELHTPIFSYMTEGGKE